MINLNDIPIKKNFEVDNINTFKKVIIAIHGFGSNKESSTITALSAVLKENNIGLIAFDLPTHGECKYNYKKLRINACLKRIKSVEKYLRGIFSGEIGFFASSFGAYLTMLYLEKYKGKYSDIILRAPALNMVKPLTNNLEKTTTIQDFKKNKKATVVTKKEIYVSYNFYVDLLKNNIFDKTAMITNTINIIYGTKDITIDNNDIFKLAKIIDCNLFPIENADHRFKNDEDLQKMIEITLKVLGS